MAQKLDFGHAEAALAAAYRNPSARDVKGARQSQRSGITAAEVAFGRLPITCTIVAKDEADRIAQAMASVAGLVDEVLVIDSGSTDGTVELCESLGARVLFNAWEGFGPQKRFAEDHARHDWVLNLDSDERLSDLAAREIRRFFADGPAATTAFRIRTRLVYPGRKKPCLFADFHNYIRLYNKTATRFRNSLAHDEVLATAHVVQLRGEILHVSFRSVSHVVQKLLNYAELQRKETKGVARSIGLRVFYELPFQFLKYYFLRRHIFGGRAGFVYALALAVSRWLRLLVISGW
jgi:glycosyltransferase involved in cell wall biosynthesis